MLLRHKTPEIRSGAARVIGTLSKYREFYNLMHHHFSNTPIADSLDAILQSKLPHTLVEYLHDSEVKVLHPLTSVFCVLVNQGVIYL